MCTITSCVDLWMVLARLAKQTTKMPNFHGFSQQSTFFSTPEYLFRTAFYIPFYVIVLHIFTTTNDLNRHLNFSLI